MSFSFSLRTTLLSVALAALGMAALVNASQAWRGAIVSLSVFCLLVAVTLAINTKERARAFWIGFVTWGVLYLVIVHLLWHSETSMSPAGLITTDFLRLLYDTIAKEVPQPLPAGFPPSTMYVPDSGIFLEIGHLLWAWLLAFIGGMVGRATYIRFQGPTPSQSTTSK